MLSGLCVTYGTITSCVTCCRWKEGQRLFCPVMVLQRRRTTGRRNLQKKGINGTKYALYSISPSVLDRGRTCWHRITLCLTVLWRGRTYNRTDIDLLPLIVCPWVKEAYNISNCSIWPSDMLSEGWSTDWPVPSHRLSLSEGGPTTKQTILSDRLSLSEGGSTTHQTRSLSPTVLEWRRAYNKTDYSIWPSVLEWRWAYNKIDHSVWLSLSEGGSTDWPVPSHRLSLSEGGPTTKQTIYLTVCPWVNVGIQKNRPFCLIVLEWGRVYRLTRSLSPTVLEWRWAYNKIDHSVWPTVLEWRKIYNTSDHYVWPPVLGGRRTYNRIEPFLSLRSTTESNHFCPWEKDHFWPWERHNRIEPFLSMRETQQNRTISVLERDTQQNHFCPWERHNRIGPFLSLRETRNRTISVHKRNTTE